MALETDLPRLTHSPPQAYPTTQGFKPLTLASLLNSKLYMQAGWQGKRVDGQGRGKGRVGVDAKRLRSRPV